MFFDDPMQLPELILRNHFSIYTACQNADGLRLKNPLIIEKAEKKASIGVEDVEVVRQFIKNRLSDDFVVVVRDAHLLTPAAQNSLLKTLEEPNGRVHFAFFTDWPNQLLPTVLSRAHLYVLREERNPLELGEVSKKTLEDAKVLLKGATHDLIALGKSLKTREQAISLVGAAIDLAEKSYLKTKNSLFLGKTEKLLRLDGHLRQNGHIKLHLITDMVD